MKSHSNTHLDVKLVLLVLVFEFYDKERNRSFLNDLKLLFSGIIHLSPSSA